MKFEGGEHVKSLITLPSTPETYEVVVEVDADGAVYLEEMSREGSESRVISSVCIHEDHIHKLIGALYKATGVNSNRMGEN